jgi:hypothetical protein
MDLPAGRARLVGAAGGAVVLQVDDQHPGLAGRTEQVAQARQHGLRVRYRVPAGEHGHLGVHDQHGIDRLRRSASWFHVEPAARRSSGVRRSARKARPFG